MANTTVNNAVSSGLANLGGVWGPFWVDTLIGVVVFQDSGNDLSYARTINGGTSWATTVIHVGTMNDLACWFDKETPGDTGNLLHIAWIDQANTDALYQTLNIATNTLGTRRTIDNTFTSSATAAENFISITKTRNGNLLVNYRLRNNEIETYRSIDAGVTWTDRTDAWETVADYELNFLYPANTGDDADAISIYFKRSTAELSIKMYDDSANTWTKTAWFTTASTPTATVIRQTFDAAIRHSDNHLLVAIHNFQDDPTDDLLIYDINPNSIASPTITAKTSIFTNQAEAGNAGIIIDQNLNESGNYDVYVAYGKSTTYTTDTLIVFHKSSDGMTSWGSEQAYSQTGANIRMIGRSHTISPTGGRIQWAYNEATLNDILVNLVNDVIVPAAGGATSTIHPHTVDNVALDQYPKYSYESAHGLAINDTARFNSFTTQNYLDSQADDSVYTNNQGIGEFNIFVFKYKNSNNTDMIDLEWNGKSTKAPSTFPVYLQIWNNTDAVWETVTSNNSASASTDFTLTGTITSNLSKYYKTGNEVTARVYQENY